jgi:hypothetical protein
MSKRFPSNAAAQMGKNLIAIHRIHEEAAFYNMPMQALTPSSLPEEKRSQHHGYVIIHTIPFYGNQQKYENGGVFQCMKDDGERERGISEWLMTIQMRRAWSL